LPAAIRPGEDLPYELADRAAAEEVLALAEQASLNGPTWALVAIVARLLDREDWTETSATKALAANEFPHAYYELSCRTLLAQGRTVEALVFANRLQAGRPADPNANLLQAEALHARGEFAAADLALEQIESVGQLSLPGRLRLGRLLVALERWNRLEALLGSLAQVPRESLPHLNYLRAILAIQRDRLPEALAIIENLLAEQPGDYELRTWRGVALLYARQYQAARQALAHAAEQPDRPEAWHWRGMLELRLGNPAEAIPFFQHALAASQRFAPAHEALGTISLNQGDLTTALQNLENAVAANARRGSAHLLIAVTRAKLSQPGETAEALRAALRLDPSLLEAARQTEVISQLFSADELAKLAADGESVVRDPPDPE
jgi:tetratricopeptide (TPR) repeat protein